MLNCLIVNILYGGIKVAFLIAVSVLFHALKI